MNVSVRRPARAARCPRPGAPRRGMSMIEVILTITVAALVLAIAGPKMRAFREGSAVRSARQEIATAIEASRGAALQRGRTARVRIRTDSVVVTVDTGAPGALASGRYTVLGPMRLDQQYVVTLTPVVATDSVLAYDARGLANPRLDHVAIYRITRGNAKDSVCVSKLGMILPRGCTP